MGAKVSLFSGFLARCRALSDEGMYSLCLLSLQILCVISELSLGLLPAGVPLSIFSYVRAVVRECVRGDKY